MSEYQSSQEALTFIGLGNIVSAPSGMLRIIANEALYRGG